MSHIETAAEAGLRIALARGQTKPSGSKTIASLHPQNAARVASTPALARAAGPSRPKSRVQVVADAVKGDPKCKGKASQALALLADDTFVGISGAGIVKMLQLIPGSGEGGANILSDVIAQNARVYGPHHGAQAGQSGNHGWAGIREQMLTATGRA